MTNQKIGIAIVHGIGDQSSDFASEMIDELYDRVRSKAPSQWRRLELEPIHWAPELSRRENQLLSRMKREGDMDWQGLRNFFVQFAGDAIAYQQNGDAHGPYCDIHKTVARGLKRLASPERAGPDAPLIVIGHSLGSVILSNYIWDLERVEDGKPIHEEIRNEIGDSDLERGRTLMSFYTLGSPLAVWSLRFPENSGFDSPITVPAKSFAAKFPNAGESLGKWDNYYDSDDIIGYPLKPLNPRYRAAVREDISVNVGKFLSGWTPASHSGYLTDNDVTKPIARDLIEALEAL